MIVRSDDFEANNRPSPSTVLVEGKKEDIRTFEMHCEKFQGAIEILIASVYARNNFGLKEYRLESFFVGHRNIGLRVGGNHGSVFDHSGT